MLEASRSSLAYRRAVRWGWTACESSPSFSSFPPPLPSLSPLFDLPHQLQCTCKPTDTRHHAVAAFSGYKFVPPGFHLLLWSLDAATGLPLRSALLKTWAPKERYALALSDEEVIARTDVEEAELRALDPQLAPYPFASLETWKSLSAPISTAVLEEVLESVGGRVDSMTPVEGEKDELEAVMVRKRPRGKEDVGRREGEKKDEEKGDGADQREDALPKSPAVSEGQVVKHTPNTDSIRLPLFDLRRSWPDGAKGDDVTRWSQDKSKLWERVASEHGGEYSPQLPSRPVQS